MSNGFLKSWVGRVVVFCGGDVVFAGTMVRRLWINSSGGDEEAFRCHWV